MSDPLFVPPIRFSLISAVSSGQLHAIDVVIYQYLLAHSDSWVIRESDICERFSLSRATYHRARARLVKAGLMTPGKGHRDRSRATPPKLVRLGQYERHVPDQVSLSGLTSEATTDQLNGPTKDVSGLTDETRKLTGASDVPDLSPPASLPLSVSDGQTNRLSKPVFDCRYCPETYERVDKLSVHVYAEHRSDYQDFMAWFSSYKRLSS